MDAGPRIDSYEWRGGREAMLRWGPDDGPVVVVALPLFEEANRFRSIAAATMRALAMRGIGGAVPDLPGMGESLIATRDARLPNWRAAFAAAAGSLRGPVHALGVRGGALIDGGADVASRWHLSPVEGSALARELRRTRAVAGGELYAGNALADELVAALETAEPTVIGPVRIVRLASDPRAADAKLDFPAPWRAAEPNRDDALGAAIAHDVARWIAACDG